MTQPTTAAPAAPARPRLESIDLLRGLVMVLMAIDHVRHYFHFEAIQGHDPTDLDLTTPAVFFTRFITHFCAPIFAFLAGTGTSFSAARGKPKGELASFLVSRGAWLIFLDLTLYRWLAWQFDITLHSYILAILWALGWSMVFLALIIRLPVRVVGWIERGADRGPQRVRRRLRPMVWVVRDRSGRCFMPEAPSRWAVISSCRALPAPAMVRRDGRRLRVRMDFITWRSHRPAPEAGLAGIRAHRGVCGVAVHPNWWYGDPHRWETESSPLYTTMSFLNVTKYPPSLLYLLLTLGVACLLLAWFEFDRGTPPISSAR